MFVTDSHALTVRTLQTFTAKPISRNSPDNFAYSSSYRKNSVVHISLVNFNMPASLQRRNVITFIGALELSSEMRHLLLNFVGIVQINSHSHKLTDAEVVNNTQTQNNIRQRVDTQTHVYPNTHTHYHARMKIIHTETNSTSAIF